MSIYIIRVSVTQKSAETLKEAVVTGAASGPGRPSGDPLSSRNYTWTSAGVNSQSPKSRCSIDSHEAEHGVRDQSRQGRASVRVSLDRDGRRYYKVD